MKRKQKRSGTGHSSGSHSSGPRNADAFRSKIARLEADVQKLREKLALEHADFEAVQQMVIESQGEQELSRERYVDLYDSAPIGLVMLDRNGFVREANLTAARMLGVARLKLLNTLLAHFVVQEDRRKLLHHLSRCRRSHGMEQVTTEVQLVRAECCRLDIELVSLPTPPTQKPSTQVRFRTALRDITKRKQAEQALRVNEEQYRLLFELNPNPMWIFDEDTLQFLAVNEAVLKLYGWSREEFLRMTVKDIRPPEEVPVLLTMLAQQREQGVIFIGEWRHWKKDHTMFNVEVTISCIRFQGREARLTMINDITTRKQAEEMLRQGKALSEALNKINETLHSSLDSTHIIQRLVAEGAAALGSDTAAVSLREDGGWRVSHVHGIPARLIGRRMADDQERHAVLAIRTRQPVAVANAFNNKRFNRAHLCRHKIPAVLVAPLIVRDNPLGVIFFNYHNGLHDFSEAEVNFARQLASTAAIALDNARLFEERKRAEEAEQQLLQDVEEQRARLQAIVDSLPVGLWIADAKGKITLMNDHARQIWGGKAPAAGSVKDYGIYRAWWADTSKRIIAKDMPMARSLRGEVCRNLEVDFERFDGMRGTQLVSSAPIKTRKGKIAGCVTVFQDITDRKQALLVIRKLNEELEQRVKQRTADLHVLTTRLGDAQEEERQRIAAGLHDEVCQILAACHLKLIEAEEHEAQDQRKAAIQEANELLNIASDQVRGLTFELSSKALFQAGFVPAASELCAHLQRRHRIRFKIDCAEDDLFVPEQLRPCLYHCLRELLYNVVKHAGVNQALIRIEMDSRSETTDRRHPKFNTQLVRISVRDYGKGFDTKDLNKPLTRNGGFGLYHIRERLVAVGGRLYVKSVAGDGTKAVVEVPIA